MKKKMLVLFILFFSSIAFSQDMQYRISESKYQQKNIAYSQGGVLLRFEHQELQRINFDSKAERFWQCKELWIPKNTKAERVKTFIQETFTKMNIISLNSIISNYQAKTQTDEVVSWNQKEIVEKLIELESRLANLEKP